MPKKSVITFKLSELNSFLEDPKSCVTCVRKKQHLSILPWCLSNLKKSIENILNKKATLFDKNLGGILLSARNITLLSSLGALRHDSPEIHIDIEADFYIFKPEMGSVLEGIIVKKSDQFLGCLVHRVFNISIPRNTDYNWPGSYLEIGNNVTFQIIYMDLTGRLPYIRGEIDASSMEFEDVTKSITSDNEVHIHLEKRKKNKKITFDDEEVIENVNETLDEVDNIAPPMRKRDKKYKKNHEKSNLHLDESIIKHETSDVFENSLNQSSEKKSKKKKKRNSSFCEQAENDNILDECDYSQHIDSKTKKKHNKINNTDLNGSLSKHETSEINESFGKKSKKKSKHNDLCSDEINTYLTTFKINKDKIKKSDANKTSESDDVSIDSPKIKKSKKNHTDSEGYSSENVFDTKNKKSNKFIDESIKNNLLNNLLNLAKSGLSPIKKLKNDSKNTLENNESFQKHNSSLKLEEKSSKKRKLSLESTPNVKRFKKE